MIDPERPIESAAARLLAPVLNQGAGHKLETMRRMVAQYELDGAILHSDRSCKPYSIGQMDQRDRLIHDFEIPALLLDADHNDSRAFAEEQVANRLAAFMELFGGITREPDFRPGTGCRLDHCQAGGRGCDRRIDLESPGGSRAAPSESRPGDF